MQAVLGCGSMNGANLGCFMLPSPWKKSSAFCVRMVSLPCDNSSGQLEAEDLPKLGFLCVCVVGSGEQKHCIQNCCLSATFVCRRASQTPWSRAADWPPAPASLRLPALRVHACKEQPGEQAGPRLLPLFFAQILPRRKKLLPG